MDTMRSTGVFEASHQQGGQAPIATKTNKPFANIFECWIR